MPLYTAPFEELSTLMVAEVPPFQPEIVPSSVQNKKLALVVPIRNTVVVFASCPLTGPAVAPLSAAPGGIATFSVDGVIVAVALVEYTVARPVPLSLIQKGLVADSAIPQGLIKFGSVTSATPAVSATKLC